MKSSLRYLRLQMVVEGIIGFESHNPTMIKEIGKSYLHKAALLTKFGQYKTALFKYHQAFQCFCSVISFHSNSFLSKKKKLDKEVNYLVVSLIAIAQLLYKFGHLLQGAEALRLLVTICQTYYKSTSEMNDYVASMIYHYESYHNRLMRERLDFEKIITRLYKQRFDAKPARDDSCDDPPPRDWLHDTASKVAIRRKDEEAYFVELFEREREDKVVEQEPHNEVANLNMFNKVSIKINKNGPTTEMDLDFKEKKRRIIRGKPLTGRVFAQSEKKPIYRDENKSETNRSSDIPTFMK